MIHRVLPPTLLFPGCPLNWQSPVNAGLLAWWIVLPQRAGGSLWWDVVGRSKGTLTNMSTSAATSGWGLTTRVGGYGELLYDGTNDFVTTPTTAIFNLAAGTVAVWAKRRNAAAEHAIVSFGDGSLNGSNFFLLEWVDTTDTLSVSLASADAVLWGGLTASSFPAGVWTHLVVTVGSSGNALYVNGVPVTLTYSPGSAASTQFLSTPFATLTTFDVGRLNCTNFPLYMPGSVDDVRIYNRALTALEVEGLWQASQTGYTQELQWQPYPPLVGRPPAFVGDDESWYYLFQEAA